MTKYLIDTADIKFIEGIIKDFSKHIDPQLFQGVTTNPSAFSKVGKTSLGQWVGHIRELSHLLKGTYPARELHVQIPNSNMDTEDIFEWINLIESCIVGRCELVLKISPFTEKKTYLSNKVKLNVTGLADATIALSCSDGPSYVSIIPGRMEEVGINAYSHVRYAAHRGHVPVIAGSMRTLEGVRNSIQAGAIPTIGPAVLELMRNDPSILTEPIIAAPPPFNTPMTDDRSNDLRIKFFEQMDTLGAQCYREFINL